MFSQNWCIQTTYSNYFPGPSVAAVDTPSGHTWSPGLSCKNFCIMCIVSYKHMAYYLIKTCTVQIAAVINSQRSSRQFYCIVVSGSFSQLTWSIVSHSLIYSYQFFQLGTCRQSSSKSAYCKTQNSGGCAFCLSRKILLQ